METDPDAATATRPVLERRKDDLVGVSSAKLYLFSALGLTVLMVFSFLAIMLTHMLTQPDQPLDLKGLNYLFYLLTAIIVALFAAAGINVVNVLDGHQATMIRLVGEKERAKGLIEGLKENPNTNIA